MTDQQCFDPVTWEGDDRKIVQKRNATLFSFCSCEVCIPVAKNDNKQGTKTKYEYLPGSFSHVCSLKQPCSIFVQSSDDKVFLSFEVCGPLLITLCRIFMLFKYRSSGLSQFETWH